MARSEGKPGLRAGNVAPAAEDPTVEAMESLRQSSGMVQTRTTYQTAIAITKARKMGDVEAKILEEASRCGEDFVYAWRVRTTDLQKDEGDGKTTIQGVSIDGAMILARNWGNCVVPVHIEQETPTHFVLAAEFIDLETGFTVPRLYRQRKNQTTGKMEADRAEDIAFQIGQSKAQRNVIVKAIPQWLQDRAVEVAKDKAAEKYADTAQWYPKVVHYAENTLKVPVANLIHRLHGKRPEQWSKFDLLALRIAFGAIKEGETTAENEFPAPPPPEAKDAKATAPATEVIVTPSGAEVEVPAGSQGTKPPEPETKAPAGETKAPPPETKTAQQLEDEEAERVLSAKEAREREAAAAKGGKR